jgi:cell wall-associated NlpC family hydrolase
MYRGIEKFQKDHGLKVDQVANPGGPTEKALNQALDHPSVRNGGRYDPNQSRDWHGRWTSAGGGGGRKSLLHHAAGEASSSGNRDISLADGKNIVAAAVDWKNTPYAPDIPSSESLAGAKARKKEGADCSGSTYHIFKEAGLPYNYRQSSRFAESAERKEIPFREISAEELRPGDVVLYEKLKKGEYTGYHMSVYAGDAKVYSATNPKGKAYDLYPMADFGTRRRYYRYQDSSRKL